MWNLKHTKQFHAHIIGCGCDATSLSKIAFFYISYDCMADALKLLDEIPNPCSYLWNMLIRGCATSGLFHLSIELYSKMWESGLRPNKFAFPFTLKACAGLSDLQAGKVVHQQSICCGCSNDRYVNAALVDMYSKCGNVEDARLVFDKMPHRDLVSWTSMISGYAHNGFNCETLEFFNFMRSTEVKPNRVSLLSALLACGRLGTLRKGEWFHNFVIQTGFEDDILVATAIIDMYAKCGCLNVAKYLFDQTSGKDVVCWSSMIAHFGVHGHGRKAIDLFQVMVNSGVKPNHVTFTSLLSACSHSGLLEEGRKYFYSMYQEYDISPMLSHYACMVDLLGRSGQLHEAERLIKTMSVKPDMSIWGSLLGACRIYSDMNMADRIADEIFTLNPGQSGYYVLLSNIYATKSRWEDVERVRKLMREKRVHKDQGYSLVECKNNLFKFGVEDRSNPQTEKIFSFLEELVGPMRQLGYVPLTDYALHDVEDETKEISLTYHSERLAVAFASLNTSPETPIRITKNLRICGDCHEAIKLMSKILNRSIIIRDINRFHLFEGGSCSCGDYW